jgi:hypothetical protein
MAPHPVNLYTITIIRYDHISGTHLPPLLIKYIYIYAYHHKVYSILCIYIYTYIYIYDVGKTIINLHLGMVYPIYGDDWGMVYSWFNHIFWGVKAGGSQISPTQRQVH